MDETKKNHNGKMAYQVIGGTAITGSLIFSIFTAINQIKDEIKDLKSDIEVHMTRLEDFHEIEKERLNNISEEIKYQSRLERKQR